MEKGGGEAENEEGKGVAQTGCPLGNGGGEAENEEGKGEIGA